MMKTSHIHIKRTDTGMVSIIVTMIMMIVISLIVLGFAQVSRREQRQVLDRSLSTQAFLAAESGVNEVVKLIRATPATTSLQKTSCTDTANGLYSNLKPNIATGVSYTCVMVNTDKVKEVIGSVSADGGSVVMPIHPASGSVSTVKLAWSLPTPPTSVASCSSTAGSFPKAGTGDWTCPYGVLRVDLVPTSSLQRDTLRNQQRTIFFYPVKQTSPNVAYATADGSVSPMYCTTTQCSATISGVSGSTNYSLRAMAIYNAGTLTMNATDSSNNTLNLKDAQAVIDVTGKAQDVLRRIQVRVSLSPDSDSSNYALDSASAVCKRFAQAGTTFRVPNDITVTDTTNPMCKVMSVGP